MTTRYYLDESGNSGDLTKSGKSLSFDGQPVFALACVGLDDEASAREEIERLKAKHHVNGPELKSSSLVGRPGFTFDVVSWLVESRAPIFVEVVDKRFQLCIHIVNHQVLPFVGDIDFAPETVWIKRHFVEFLYALIPNDVVETFIAACDSPGTTSVRLSLETLAEWLRKNPPHEVGTAILQGVEECIVDLDEDGKNDADAYRLYLPIPDDSRTGKPIWMLPNLTCFTNIYARINLFHRGNLSGVTLVHDEQLHFEHILTGGKTLAESLAKKGAAPPARYADYDFSTSAGLSFETSTDNVGVEVADVIAGFLMRYTRDGTGPDPLADALGLLVDVAEPNRGTGINFLTSGAKLVKMGIPWS